MTKIIHWKKRPFVYALVISIGFAFLRSVLRDLESKYYFYIASALYFIIVFELFSTFFHARTLLEQFSLPPVKSKDRLIQTIHHIILPTVLYIGLVGLSFFNRFFTYDLIIVTFVFIIFSLLFTNVRAFYEDKFKLEKSTHYIYDLINIISIYLFAELTLQVLNYNEIPLTYATFPVTVVFFALTMISLYRYHYANRTYFRIVSALSLIVAIIVGLTTYLGFTITAVGFLIVLFAYFLIAFLNHQQDGTFNKAILSEYVIVFILCFILLIGIS